MTTFDTHPSGTSAPPCPAVLAASPDLPACPPPNPQPGSRHQNPPTAVAAAAAEQQKPPRALLPHREGFVAPRREIHWVEAGQKLLGCTPSAPGSTQAQLLVLLALATSDSSL